MNHTQRRWIAICLIPIILIGYFTLNPADNPTDHMMNTIIMACAATFLTKYVLFAIIWTHLKHEAQEKRHAWAQLVPLGAFIMYIIWYALSD